MANLICPLPGMPGEQQLARWVQQRLDKNKEQPLVGIPDEDWNTAATRRRSTLQRELEVEWLLVVLPDRIEIKDLPEPKQLTRRFAAALGQQCERSWMEDYGVLPGWWAREVLELTRVLLSTIVEPLWLRDLWPSNLTSRKTLRLQFVIELTALTPAERAARGFLQQFDQLVNETKDVTQLTVEECRAKTQDMGKLLERIPFLGHKDEPARVPPRFSSLDRLKHQVAVRERNLDVATAKGKVLVDAFIAFEKSVEVKEPVTLDESWKAFSDAWKELVAAELSTWASEVAPRVPSLEDLGRRYQTLRPKVASEGLERWISRAEVVFGSNLAVENLAGLTARLKILEQGQIGNSKALRDRLGSLAILTIHQKLVRDADPAELDWLVLAVSLLQDLIGDGSSVDACRAAARQIALHLAHRPDLICGGLQAGTKSTKRDEVVRANLLKVIEGTTEIITRHRQDLAGGPRTRERCQMLDDMADHCRPLLAWLQGVARPWFMEPGVPEEDVQRYAHILQEVEVITGLSWAGAVEL